MDLFQVIVLALIQGITEFLPISSSAHLILPKELLGWPDQGLAFDVAVHVGTLMAVVVYFRRDIQQILLGWISYTFRGNKNTDGQIGWYIIFATIPAGLVGLLFDDLIETHLRSIAVIAMTTIVYGILLGVADKKFSGVKTLAQMTMSAAIIIGVAQALALVPGTSRSGVTITAALFLGFCRSDAARFSFLMSIPVILLSGGFKGLDLLGEQEVDWLSIFTGIAVSAISAYLCIHYFLRFINKMSMLPFVIYRLILGVVLIAMIV